MRIGRRKNPRMESHCGGSEVRMDADIFNFASVFWPYGVASAPPINFLNRRDVGKICNLVLRYYHY